VANRTGQVQKKTQNRVTHPYLCRKGSEQTEGHLSEETQDAREVKEWWGKGGPARRGGSLGEAAQTGSAVRGGGLR